MGEKTQSVTVMNRKHNIKKTPKSVIAMRNGKHRKTTKVFTKHNEVKVVKTPKALRTLSKGLLRYNQILRTVREFFPYGYREAQKLSSEMYRSGVDSESAISMMKTDSEISRRKDSKKMEELANIIRDWESARSGEDYKIHKVYENFNTKFQTWFDEYKVNLGKNAVDIDPINVFMDIINKVKRERDLVDGDKIRLIISHDTWRAPYSSGLLNVNEGLEQMMANKCGQFVEYKEVPLSDVKIEVQSFKIPRGKGRLHVAKNTVGRKKCIITIKNDDSTCMSRAIVTAMANLNKTKWTKSQLNNGFNKSRKLQKEQALKLHDEADVEVNDFGNTLEDVKKFANHLGVQINIVDGDQFNNLVYISDEVCDRMIYLYKNGNHFDVITSMPGFLCKDYYCHTCKKTYTHRDKHKCPSKCIACFKYFPNGIKCSGDVIKCNSCNRSFFGQACFNEHTRVRGINDVVCAKVGKCLNCERTVTTTKDTSLKDHICGHSECSNCHEYCNMSNHKCFMTLKQCKGGNCKTRTEKYMFYDFECTQETGVHMVNLAVVHDYQGTEYVFRNIDEFCNFVFKDTHRGYTFIAHNSKGYDAQFILKWCVENSQKPYCIYAGTKIMSMEIQSLRIRFIDSLNFVASALAAFPKTFGLKELKKGYFPHYFNKLCNQNYVGVMPSKTHYGYNTMSTLNRESFLDWYEARVAGKYEFDFQKEILEYCRSDVDILRRSMMKFREDFIKLENIDPLQYVTIASVCMDIYRANYMPSDTIGVVKDVTRGETYSKVSIAWLDWISQRDDIKIQHALTGCEVNIKDIGKVDGFCDNTVYEFQGCFWHGCKKCYSDDTINTKNQIDMLTLRKRTWEKNGKIRAAGYNLVEVWECELKKDKDFMEYMKTWDREIVGSLNPRDAFFGGRTNVTKLTYDFKKSEKGKYVDFCSLYPTIQYYKQYPVGHPTKILEPCSYDDKWFGFIKCKVLPPKGLYHPVLPVKTKCGNADKLLFPLCRKCAEDKQSKCNHLDEDRSFIGTWCTNEIMIALKKGYQIEKIYEVWNFDKTSDDLFKGYVRKFTKIKMECSPLITGEGCKYKTVDDFRDVVKEKLNIDLGEIKHNPGMRAISKLCLNSLWGKFGQRNNMKKTNYVTQASEFYKILLDDSIDDLNIQFINEYMIQMTYNMKDQFVDNSNSTNIFIAAFTTSHARMMLYDVLDKLGDQVLGFDTDSAWYIERPGDATIETGDMLGELTDELDGDHIVDWVGSGPKSYSYLTNKGKMTCKVKGFTLNHENSQYINMDTMRDVINKQKDRITIVNESMITRDSKTKQIINKYQEKDFRLVYDKRSTHDDGHGTIETLPWGY